MNETAQSYRGLLRATGIVGGASIAVLFIGLIRGKAFALLVGPAGIGLLGLLSTLVATAAAVGGLGLNNSAVRELARNEGDGLNLRYGIWLLAWFLAVITGSLIWLLRFPLSMAITGSDSLSNAIGWSGLAVALTILVATQSAVFQGLRQLGSMARTNIGGVFVGTVISIAAVYVWRESGVVAAVIVIPLCIAAIGWLLMRAIPSTGGRSSVRGAIEHWPPLLHLGVGVVVTAIIGTISQLSLRSIVLRELGMGDVGLFQAAFAISTINVGLVLSAMAADYYPRLAEVSDRPALLSNLVDQQLHLAAVLSAPLLIALSAGAPLWLHLLYSNEFTGAADLLRVQVLSEVIRLPVWALGFLLLARGDRRGYVLNELAFTVGALAATLILVPRFGLVGAGVGYAIGYAASLLFISVRAIRMHDIRLGRRSSMQLLTLLVICGVLAVAGGRSPTATLGLGTLVALAAAVWAIVELYRVNALPSRIHSRIAAMMRKNP